VDDHHSQPVCEHLQLKAFLERIGVVALPPLTTLIDLGEGPLTLSSYLDQCSHLISMLKLSTACWLIATERSTRTKLADARARNIPIVSARETFAVAVAQGELNAFLDLCADFGIARIECTEDLSHTSLGPRDIVKMVNGRGMDVQVGIRKKHGSPVTIRSWKGFVDRGQLWLDAGAKQVTVETTESVRSPLDEGRLFQAALADRLATVFGLETVIFETSGLATQFAILDHFGPRVQLSNVRLEEVLQVEVYRRRLHSDTSVQDALRPHSRRL